MMIGDIQSVLIRLSEDKKFLKSRGLKSMYVDLDTMETTLILRTKHFKIKAFCEYDDFDGKKSWSVGTGIVGSAWEMIDDYLGDDMSDAWDDVNNFDISDDESVEDVATNLVDNILAVVNEEEMVARFKTLNKIIGEIEEMNSDDCWIIERIAGRFV